MPTFILYLYIILGIHVYFRKLCLTACAMTNQTNESSTAHVHNCHTVLLNKMYILF